MATLTHRGSKTVLKQLTSAEVSQLITEHEQRELELAAAAAATATT